MKTLSQVSKVKILMLLTALLLASISFAANTIASASVKNTIKVQEDRRFARPCTAHIREAETGVYGAEGNVTESGPGSGKYLWSLGNLTDGGIEYESPWYSFDGSISVSEIGGWANIEGDGNHYEVVLYVSNSDDTCITQDSFRFWANPESIPTEIK